MLKPSFLAYQILQKKKKKPQKADFGSSLLPLQVSEEELHCVLVGFWQLLDQVFDRVHSLLVVRTFWSRDSDRGNGAIVWPAGARPAQLLTDGVDEVGEGGVGEERLWKLPEEHLQGSGGDVDVLPLTVIQVQLLIW